MAMQRVTAAGVASANTTIATALKAAGLTDCLKLLEAAGGSVSEAGGFMVFRHLIAQTKMTPLPIYVKTASAEQAVAGPAGPLHQ